MTSFVKDLQVNEERNYQPHPKIKRQWLTQNWRLITLLGGDIKIIAKIITEQLISHGSLTINTMLSAFPGRSAHRYLVVMSNTYTVHLPKRN